ncbi:MAG: efflux transporter outer membrane subunit [Cytophagales bacterium]|nr:efflux transporter outer membrane subunit [Cytophagales bacterium]
MSKRSPMLYPMTGLALTLTLTLVLTACSSVPSAKKYERPVLDVPAAKPNSVLPSNWQAWWQSFQDPVLDAYLTEAIRNNQDVVLATARIAEARATLNQNQVNLYPQIDLNAGLSRTQNSQNSATYNSPAGPYTGNSQLGLSASYEVDFWGKYASANDAARARLLAQTASRGVVLSTLHANVVQAYFAMRALDAQLALAEQVLVTRQESLRLQKRRFEAGVVSQLELRQAESEAASSQATLRQTQQSRSHAESALALLLGRQPADILKPVLARGSDVGALVTRASIPADLPSDLLIRRPDIVSAEQNLIAANADIAQARTAYFPKLSLTAGLGRQSKNLSTLLNPASAFWNMIGNLSQPIFRAGAIDAVMVAANAREQQAVAQYTQTVQSAFRDVHDALSNVDAGRDLTAVTTQRIDALRSTLRLANVRYQAGYAPYLEVLNAQRDLAQAESGLVEIERGQLSAVVSVYKAMGGGWDAAKP